MRTQIKAEYTGMHPLPPLTEKELAAYHEEEFHKVRKSEHVQAMEQLVNAAHSVAPTEVNGAVFYFDSDQNEGVPAYFLAEEDDEDGFLGFAWVSFIGTRPSVSALMKLKGKTKDELAALRFEHVPPRSIVVS